MTSTFSPGPAVAPNNALRSTTATAQPQPRVASLLPFITDIVHELDLTHLLVAVSHECRTNPTHTSSPQVVTSAKLHHQTLDATSESAMAELSAVWNILSSSSEPSFFLHPQLSHHLCSYYHVDIPRLLAHSPTILLTHLTHPSALDPFEPDAREVSAVAKKTIRSLHHLESIDATTLSQIFDLHHRIANLLGRPDAAVPRVAAARTRLSALQATLSVQVPDHMCQPTVAVVQWTDPLYLAGAWIPDVIHHARARCIAPMPKSGQSSVRVPVDDLYRFDCVIFVLCSVGLSAARRAVKPFVDNMLRRQPHWPGRLAVVDGRKLFAWLGVHNVATTAEVIAEIAHPSLSLGHKHVVWQPW